MKCLNCGEELQTFEIEFCDLCIQQEHACMLDELEEFKTQTSESERQKSLYLATVWGNA